MGGSTWWRSGCTHSDATPTLGTTAREVTSLWRRSPPPRGPAEVGPRHAEGEDLVAPASCCCLLLVISGRRLCNCVCVCVYVFLVCVVPMCSSDFLFGLSCCPLNSANH